MSRERFRAQGEDSFFGRFVYDQVIPSDHFLVKLKEIIPWQRFTRKLVRYYRGRAKEGRPPYDPALLLRMLLVCYLYGLSERQTEEMADYHLPVKYFIGLAVNEKAPDHSTLTAFKARLLENGRIEAFEGMLREIIRIAQENGVQFGSIQVMDSVHTVADVNTEKDEKRQEKEGKSPRDPSARWGVKHTRRVKNQQGKVIEQKEYFHGYKAHVSFNSESELITSMTFTPGNGYDGHQLPGLLEKDLAQGIPINIVAGDRAFDDSDNHYLLACKGIHSAICLNAYRTGKKDPSKGVWLALQRSPEYKAGLKERYKVERKFGEAKTGHGLAHCRYIGLVRYAIQGFMTAIVLNLKRMVKLLTGVYFKGRARAAA